MGNHMSEHVDTVVLAPATFSPDDYGTGGNRTRQAYPAPARTTEAAQAESVLTMPPSSEDVQAALQRINEHLASVNRVIQLQVDTQTGLTIATVRNSNTGEVLQQYPAEDSLHLAQLLASWSHGGNILLDLIA